METIMKETHDELKELRGDMRGFSTVLGGISVAINGGAEFNRKVTWTLLGAVVLMALGTAGLKLIGVA